MSQEELGAERHDSAKLAEHMAIIGDPRPHPLTECHALIAGKHPQAAPLRAIMAKRNRRIDDYINGCWLPKNTAAKSQMPRRLTNAVSYRRIHRTNYFMWLRSIITLASAKTPQELDRLLTHVAFRL